MGENSILIPQSSFKSFWSNGTGELLHTEVTLNWIFLSFFSVGYIHELLNKICSVFKLLVHTDPECSLLFDCHDALN